jgi:hypothetical protein
MYGQWWKLANKQEAGRYLCTSYASLESRLHLNGLLAINLIPEAAWLEAKLILQYITAVLLKLYNCYKSVSTITFYFFPITIPYINPF